MSFSPNRPVTAFDFDKTAKSVDHFESGKITANGQKLLAALMTNCIAVHPVKLAKRSIESHRLSPCITASGGDGHRPPVHK